MIPGPHLLHSGQPPFEYLGLDPTLVRLVWVMAAFLAGWGFIAYLIAWIVMPYGPPPQPVASAVPSTAPQAAPSR